MKNLLLAVVVIVTVWLQASFLGGFRPLGVVPDPLIIVVIYAGLMRQPAEAVGMAVLGGLLLDISSGADFGLRTAFYTTLALLIMVAKQAGADFDNAGLVLLMTLGATVVFNLAVMVSPAIHHDIIHWAVVARGTLVDAGLNLALVFLLKPLLVRMFRVRSSVPVVA